MKEAFAAAGENEYTQLLERHLQQILATNTFLLRDLGSCGVLLAGKEVS